MRQNQETIDFARAGERSLDSSAHAMLTSPLRLTSHMNLDDVVVFVAVAQHSSFSAAARRLGTTRVAATRAVASLEKALGSRLLVRTTRRVALTSAGQAFYERVGGSISSLREAVQEFSHEDRQLLGSLRVGASGDFSGLSLATTLSGFVDEYPGARVELHQASDIECLTSEPLDILLALSWQSSDFSCKSFKSRYLGAIVCKPYVALDYLVRCGASLDSGDLAGHVQVATPLISELQRATSSKLASCPTHRVSCADMLLVRQLVRLGCGFGFLPPALAAFDLASGVLVPFTLGESELRLHVWLLSSDSPYASPVTGTFAEFVAKDLRARGITVP